MKPFADSPATPTNSSLTQSVVGIESPIYSLTAWLRVETNLNSDRALLGIDFYQAGSLVQPAELDLKPIAPADGVYYQDSISGVSPLGTDVVKAPAEIVSKINADADPHSAQSVKNRQ